MKVLMLTVAGLAIAGVASAATYNNAAQYAGTIGHGLRTGATSSGGAAAPAGAFWSEVQNTNTTAGFGNQQSAGNRVADNFTVGAGGWTINSIRFFGYQTGSSTTSTFTGLNYQIWSGRPGDAGSVVVFGNTTTNTLTGSSFSGDYRIFNNTPGNTRPIMNLDVSGGANLAAGTYWLDWQANGTLASGPWAPSITVLGANYAAGMNGRQLTTTGWADLLDAGSGTIHDLPFLIDYTAAPTPGAAAVFGIAGLAGLRRRR